MVFFHDHAGRVYVRMSGRNSVNGGSGDVFPHNIGEVVLVKWSDERIYYVKIRKINQSKQTCQVVFEDNRRGTADFSQIHAGKRFWVVTYTHPYTPNMCKHAHTHAHTHTHTHTRARARARANRNVGYCKTTTFRMRPCCAPCLWSDLHRQQCPNTG